jgi:hypothetical protein
MTITTHDVAVVESLVESGAKKPFTAYALWFFLGWLGAHRFYTGRKKSGFGMLALTLSVVGFPISLFWWMADAVILGSILEEERELLYDKEARLLLEKRLD